MTFEISLKPRIAICSKALKFYLCREFVELSWNHSSLSRFWIKTEFSINFCASFIDVWIDFVLIFPPTSLQHIKSLEFLFFCAKKYPQMKSWMWRARDFSPLRVARVICSDKECDYIEWDFSCLFSSFSQRKNGSLEGIHCQVLTWFLIEKTKLGNIFLCL